ncbi:DUF262 domain-containing protein [Caminibacter mediatlanticus TB-2]|uniref:DUF262 domain-containing protein n=1 Tax=Caminibacter mediatlanticus TB-2 TaxID=391592 RepID=A0ABX5VC09_9BACT|nr:DUF262 domain-containing protein [Caminibacter mediatlanticus]QCT95032.1 DUF262 domain-containing protein [Caminibacter mediatlanticus TB-2]
MKENKTYSFWELLKEVGIKIPIIQRDYAQGREDKKSKKIRENFLDTLYENVINENKSIHLDFVYGIIDRGYLIPLDGQQRLTTLFLLHYYLALKEQRLKDNKEIFQKFTYETRLSSRDFCNLLVNSDIKLDENKKISEIIKSQTWYFSEWDNDPTIKSMIIMLDAIEEKFKNLNLFDKLISTEKPPITFSFLNLKKFKLTDELYVKMNARGKPLNDFENFKAYFEKFVNDIDNKSNLDNKWYDIFWNLAKNEENPAQKADEKFLNFFKNITVFYCDECKKDKIKLENIDILKFKYTNKILEEISKVLDGLENYQDDIIYNLREYKDFEINIFQDFLNNSVTYTKRLRFYALMKFFIKYGNIKSNENLFKQWMRVSLNIINNTIYNAQSDFYKTKEILDKLVELLDQNFYKNLSTSGISDTKQFKEEKLKAKLILNNSKYEDEFIIAEKNWYLDGEIGFLIEYAGGENNFNLNKYIEYRDKFIKLWNFAKKDKLNQILIHRALLTIDNNNKSYLQYTLRNNNKATFCTFGKDLREKNENWRKVLGKESFKKLLNNINTNDIQDSLKKLIDNFKFDCNDWRSFFINPNKNWSIIKWANHYQIVFYESKDNIIYLNQGDTSVTSWSWRNGINYLFIYYAIEKLGGIKDKANRIESWRLETKNTWNNIDVIYVDISIYTYLPGLIFEKDKEPLVDVYQNEEGKIDILINKNFLKMNTQNYESLKGNEDWVYYKKNFEICEWDEIVKEVTGIFEEMKV